MMGAASVPAAPVLPIATETPAAIFEIGGYRESAALLAGLTWGAEDLSAAIGAATAREPDGRFTPPYELEHFPSRLSQEGIHTGRRV